MKRILLKNKPPSTKEALYWKNTVVTVKTPKPGKGLVQELYVYMAGNVPAPKTDVVIGTKIQRLNFESPATIHSR